MSSISGYQHTRVVKKLNADQAGALKLARRFGQALVCVRYRQDPQRGHRYTTVEIVVDEAPIQRRFSPETVVALRIAFEERALRQAVKDNGGRWDKGAGVWRVPFEAVRRLSLTNRIIVGK